jgi:hypothetical protein
MDPLNLIEIAPGEVSLTMYTGELVTDALVRTLGHEPNGTFWEGVAEWLVETKAPELEGSFDYDSEAGMFCAFGDRADLEDLRALMLPVVTDPKRLRAVVEAAEAADFEFDD